MRRKKSRTIFFPRGVFIKGYYQLYRVWKNLPFSKKIFSGFCNYCGASLYLYVYGVLCRGNRKKWLSPISGFGQIWSGFIFFSCEGKKIGKWVLERRKILKRNSSLFFVFLVQCKPVIFYVHDDRGGVIDPEVDDGLHGDRHGVLCQNLKFTTLFTNKQANK